MRSRSAVRLRVGLVRIDDSGGWSEACGVGGRAPHMKTEVNDGSGAAVGAEA